MADTIPSNETVASALDGTERWHCIQSDADVYNTPDLVKTYINPLTTKGDVSVYGTANTRLAVGSNEQILVADSSQATGLKWRTPPSPGYITNYYYTSPNLSSFGTLAVTAGTIYYSPIEILELVTAIELGIEVTTLADPGNCLVGLYNLATGKPTTKILTGTEVSTTTTGNKVSVISQVLNPGWYALAVVFSTTPTVRTTVRRDGYWQFGGVAQNTAPTTSWTEARAYDSTLPATATPVAVTAVAYNPLIWWRP